MTKITSVLFVLLLCCGWNQARATDNSYLYKVTLVQAAPGKLLELIDLYKTQAAALNAKDVGDEAPLWMRHSQGDHWDLMILFPMASYSAYYQSERAAKRAQLSGGFLDKFKDDIAWQEDLFAYGPPITD